MKLLSGNSNRALSQAIADHLDMPLTKAQVKRFADNEVFTVIEENVRGEDVFILQSTSYPANDNLMELLIITDALVRASAKRITAVVPYFGYARQDRKTGGRTPISAKLVANLITRAGADRVLTMDLHAGQIQGFFDIPTDNLVATPVLAQDIKENYSRGDDLMIVSPDVGGVVRARSLASRLDVDLAIVDKRRPKAGESEVMNIIGDVSGRRCILFDDIVDSGGTLVNAAKALIEQGATEVSAYISHGVLSGPAVQRITDDVHDFRYACLGTALVNDRQIGAEALRHRASPGHAANVGRNDHGVVEFVVVQNVARDDRRGIEVIRWNIEKSLDLGGMQIKRDDAVDPGLRDQIGDQLGRNGRAAGGATILPGIAEVRQHGGDAAGRGAAQRIRQDQQFHQIVVGGKAGGLEDEDILATHVFLNLDIDLVVRKALDRAIGQGELEVAGDRLCKRTV